MSQNQNDSSNALLLAINSIKNNDSQLLSKLIELMPLEQMDVETSNKFFSRYMSLCASYNRSDCLKIIFNAWDKVYPNDQQIPIFVKLFLLPDIDLKTLSFTALVMEEYTYLEVMDDLVKYNSDPYLIMACKRADAVYGEQPYTTYKFLRELSGDNNIEVSNFLNLKLRESSPFAPIPKWIKDFREGNFKSLPLESEIKIPIYREEGFSIPNLDEIVDLLTEGIENSGISIEELDDAKEVIRARISIATRAEKIEILKPIFKLEQNINLQEDEDIFRILGPANPLLSSSPEEMEYGGCRMFISSVFDFNNDTGYVEDWFTGYCLQCNLQIKIRWYAVRLPRPYGGWKGCFCSWKCTRNFTDDTTFNPEGQADLLTHLMIDEFETQINIIGIQDRISNNSEEENKISSTITSSVTIFEPDNKYLGYNPPSSSTNNKKETNQLIYPENTNFENFGLSQSYSKIYSQSISQSLREKEREKEKEKINIDITYQQNKKSLSGSNIIDKFEPDNDLNTSFKDFRSPDKVITSNDFVLPSISLPMISLVPITAQLIKK